MQTFLVAAAILLALLNLCASAGLALSAAYSPPQKAMQLALVWLVPIFGALIVLCFLRENAVLKKARPSPTEGSLTTPGYDFAPPNN